jgi:DNA (cytosine-5)-methyltransferase 1
MEQTIYNTKKYKLVDLCAGTGAFSLAFEQTNKVNTIFANDCEPNSKIIYDENFKLKLTLKDIHDINVKKDIQSFDILTAGFPCQAFSIAGKQLGFDDPRSNVFFKIIEIMKIHKPSIVILENVKNLQSHDEGKTFERIISEIKKVKYNIAYTILNTCEVTQIPQNRERIYIVCFKDKTHMHKFNFPQTENNKLQIKDIVLSNVPNKYYYNSKLKIWDSIENKIIKNIDTNTIYQYRRYYVRENKNNLCPTLTANMGGGGHNVPILKDAQGIRKLTPRECFNFQGFPLTYKLPSKISDSGLYKLAGNAVSFPVVAKIADLIIKILD